MKKLKNYIIMGLMAVIIVLLLINQCSKQSESSYTPEKRIINIDTSVVVNTDTIYLDTNTIQYKPKIVRDTVIIEPDGTLTKYSIYKGNETFPGADLTWKALVRGEIDSINFSLKSKMIKETTTTTINKLQEQVNNNNNFSILAGARVGGNKNTFEFSPILGVEINTIQLQYSYGLVSKTHNIGVVKKFNIYE